jgi:hypothetical protein
MNRNIEERLTKEISPLTEFLGAERVDDLKDKVCTLILEQVERDLNDRDEYVLVYADDLREIVEEALREIKEVVKKKLVDKYMTIVEDAISKQPPLDNN